VSPGAWGLVDLGRAGSDAGSHELATDRHEAAIEEAYRRGFVDGEESGARAARDELHVAMQATRRVVEDVRAGQTAWQARLQERVVVLAAAIAQKVVGRAREEDSAVFVELAQRAVAAFPAGEALRIRLHPSDRAVLSDARFLDQVVGDRSVRWISDEDVLPGGCIVEGPDRIVDGRVDEAIRRVARALTDG
jgi:flagellar assembly protein FliH